MSSRRLLGLAGSRGSDRRILREEAGVGIKKSKWMLLGIDAFSLYTNVLPRALAPPKKRSRQTHICVIVCEASALVTGPSNAPGPDPCRSFALPLRRLSNSAHVSLQSDSRQCLPCALPAQYTKDSRRRISLRVTPGLCSQMLIAIFVQQGVWVRGSIDSQDTLGRKGDAESCVNSHCSTIKLRHLLLGASAPGPSCACDIEKLRPFPLATSVHQLSSSDALCTARMEA